MTHDEDQFPCKPRTGRALWSLRARYVWHHRLDMLVHRLHREPLRDHGRRGDRRTCWPYDDVWLERFVHDQRFHDRVATHMTPVGITGPGIEIDSSTTTEASNG